MADDDGIQVDLLGLSQGMQTIGEGGEALEEILRSGGAIDPQRLVMREEDAATGGVEKRIPLGLGMEVKIEAETEEEIERIEERLGLKPRATEAPPPAEPEPEKASPALEIGIVVFGVLASVAVVIVTAIAIMLSKGGKGR